MQENFIDGGKPLSVRFTEDEAEFINENYEKVSGTIDRLTLREFFYKAILKSVSMVKPQVAIVARQEDIAEIESLRAQLVEAKADIETKTAFISEITANNVELDTRVSGLVDELDKANETIQAYKACQQVPALPENALVLELNDAESALCNDYANIMKTTVKDVLVNKLFVQTVLYGPGDYIPILKSPIRSQLKVVFKK